LWASVVAGLAALSVSLMVQLVARTCNPFSITTPAFTASSDNIQPFNSNRPYHFEPWAISAASQSDAWIVGAPARVAWHWNGTAWEKIAMAPPPRSDDE
jgi:hypothetical protein